MYCLWAHVHIGCVATTIAGTTTSHRRASELVPSRWRDQRSSATGLDPEWRSTPYPQVVQAATLSGEFKELMRRGRALANASQDAAAALWDGFLVAAAQTPPQRPLAYEAYIALMERLALPLPLSGEVIEAAQCCVHGREGELLPDQEADFYLLVATARFDRGEASFAECLRTYENAVSTTLAYDSAGLAPGRSIDQLGFLAGALLDIGAHEEATQLLGDALAQMGLAPTLPCDSATFTLAVERLVDGDEAHPVMDLWSGSPTPAVQTPPGPRDPGGQATAVGAGIGHAEPSSVESLGWLRQLEADAAAQRGDADTSVALYQALTCLYERDGAAFALTAAGVLAEVAHASDACRLMQRLLETDVCKGNEVEALTIATGAFLAAGDLPKTRALHDRARSYLDQRPNIRCEPDLRVYAARLARHEGDTTTATLQYIGAVSAALDRRRAQLEPRLDDCAMRAVVRLANEAVDHCLEVGDPWSLVWVTDAVKSARLQAVLEANAANLIGEVEDALPVATPVTEAAAAPAGPERSATSRDLEEISQQLRRQHRIELTACAVRIEKLNQRILIQQDDLACSKLVEELDREHAARDHWVRQSGLYDPIWRSFSAPQHSPVGADTFVCVNTTAVSLYRYGARILAMVIVDGACKTGVKDLSNDTVRNLLRYVNNVTSPDTEEVWSDPSALGLCVEDFLTDDLVDHVVVAGQVVLAPHEELHLLPWAMVACRGRRLVEHVDVAQAPNLGCLRYLPQLSNAAPRLALFCPATGATSPPLDTAAEVEALWDLAGDRAVAAILEEDASAEALLGLLTRTDVDAVHVASHGLANRSDPQGTGVVAADRVCNLTDFIDLKAHARELFASSCLLGWRPLELHGQRMAADEALGVPAAFMAAGGAAMIASITPAQDTASSVLARYYYEERFDAGLSSLPAWSNALRRMLASSYPAAAWCGYTYFGGAGTDTHPDP